MLSSQHRAVLEAVARRVAPQAYDGGAGAVDLVARIVARLEHAPPERVRDLRLALSVLGSRAAALLLSGLPAPFPGLSSDRQDTLLARWSTSPLTVARSVYQGVRRLVLAVYYSQPESFTDLGYVGPFHLRDPAVPWEGPLRGERLPPVEDPVARVARGSTWTARTAAPVAPAVRSETPTKADRPFAPGPSPVRANTT